MADALTPNEQSVRVYKRYVDASAWIHRCSDYRNTLVHAYYDTAWFRQIENRPDSAFTAPGAEILKDDTSSSVARISFDGRNVIIKRYNPRNPLYAAKRSFRISRAARCLDAARHLRAAGIACPTPLGYIEKRFFVFKGTSYYLCLYERGETLTEVFARCQSLNRDQQTILDAVESVFDKLHANRIRHGDMKYSNLLWQNHDRLVLLDLDATRRIDDDTQLKRELSKDLNRFIKNFADRPALQQQIKKRFAALAAKLNPRV